MLIGSKVLVTFALILSLTKFVDSEMQSRTGALKSSKFSLISKNSTTRTTLLDLDLSLASCRKINLREVSVTRLQSALMGKKLTSLELVQCYTKRIQAMDPYLHSVLEINPDAEKIAKVLDKTRIRGLFYGPMYGIPILLKDNLDTGDMMETTSGSKALLGIKPKEDSEVVKLLRRAGAIILGKANQEEFAGRRSVNAPQGWSGRGGRTSNAYVLSAGSSGSSSGSAVAVAANLVPVSLGTETCGSIIAPSSVASLVGLKTTVGRVSTAGVIPLIPGQDVVGPIAKSVSDAAIIFNIISKNGFNHACYSPSKILANCINKVKLTFRVGVLRDPEWTPSKGVEPNTLTEQLPRLNKILQIMKNTTGITVVDPVGAASGTEDAVTLSSEYIVTSHAFKSGLNRYLRTKVKNNEVKTENGIKIIRTMTDVIKYNERFPEAYDQQKLKEADATDGIHNRTYIAERLKNRDSAQIYFDYVFLKYSLDALVRPTSAINNCTSFTTRVAAVSGYPYITIPAGFDSRGVPFGISFLGLPNSDENLLILAHMVERVLKARKPSQFLTQNF